MTILEELFGLQDKTYAEFQAKLLPITPKEQVIGVRVPALRKLAKQLPDRAGEFLTELPHQYYDENLLHGILISQIRDFDTCIRALEVFLPYVDNWAVCDTMSPKVLGDNREVVLPILRRWIASDHIYTCRFGLLCLMRYYLDDGFRPEYLELAAAVRSDEYYVRMMVSWFFATALAKQWDASIVYLQQRRLSPWVHSKTIQKARESYRITPEQKAYLATLR